MVAHPFGITNTTTVYQEAMQDRFADQIDHIYKLTKPDLPKADQFAPAVNMVHIHQLDDDSLLPILEEHPRSESEGYIGTADSSTITPSHFGGEIFMVNHDSAIRDDETNS